MKSHIVNIRWNTVLAAVVGMILGGAHILRAAPLVRAGEQRRWTLAFRTRLEQPGPTRPVEIGLAGDWVSTVVTVRAHEYDASLQLMNARLSGGANNVSAAQREQMSKRLERVFWVTYHEDGSLAAVHFYQDTDPTDRNLLQMVATECQLVQGPAGQGSWTAAERDGAGQYAAAYERAGNAVTKHKTNYLRADGAPQKNTEGVRVEIDRAEYRFTMDGDGGVAALDGDSRIRLGVSIGNSGQLVAVTEIHLSGLRRSMASALVGSLEHANAEVVSSPIRTHQPNPEETRARLDGQLLEGRTTVSVLQGVSGTDPLAGERLAALFRQRADAAGAAVEYLRASGPHARITDALGIAGSAPALKALESLMGDRSLPRPLRIDALTAFLRVQHPSVDAMRAPAALLDDENAEVAAAARIASGGLAHAGRADHPREADAIDAALAERYSRARDVQEMSNVIAALGNSASESVLPTLEQALRDSRATIRNAAATSMRLVEGARVDGLLAATMTGDGDAGVRAAAVFAASFRRPMSGTLADALVRAAKTDSAEHVRVAAINLLRKNAAAAPGLAETLRWIAAHDAEANVRKLAQDALRGL